MNVNVYDAGPKEETTMIPMTLAEKIADYMVVTGTKETSTGNWVFCFDEINDKFSVNLPADSELLTAISMALGFMEQVLDLEVDDECFDLIFGLQWCDIEIENSKEETTMDKIKMHENDSIRNLTEVMVNSCGIDRAQANAAVNAVERARHNQFGTIGKFKEATGTDNGRKELIGTPHLGPKRLGYLMRALHFIDIKYNNTDDDIVEELIPNNERTKIMDNSIKEQGITILKRSTIGRVTIYLKEPVNGLCSNAICSDYLKSRPVGDHPFYTEYYIDNTDEFIHPVGLKIVDNDEFMPGFVRVSTESGYSVTIAKDSIFMMETEMFPVEE